MKTSKEDLISNYMTNLEISREEAINLLEEDQRIDKLTSTREINSDLSEEQLKVARAARTIKRGPNFNFDVSKRKKVENVDRIFLIENLRDSLETVGATTTILNAEREFEFVFKDTKYKIVLSVPRK